MPRQPWPRWFPAVAGEVAVALLATACGNGSPSAPQLPPSSQSPPSALPPPAEPEQAPPPTERIPPDSVLALPGGEPEGAVVDPRTGVLAVALREPDRLALVDLETREVRTVPSFGAARHLASGGPGQILVPGENTDLLTRLALPEGRPVERIKVGRQPHDAVQVGNTVFVANELGGSLGVVRDGAMVRVLRAAVQPGGLAAAGSRVAAVDVRGNRLHIIDTTTLDEVAALPAGQGPSHVRPLGGGRVAVADTRGHAVLTVQVSGTPRRLGTTSVPGRAYGLATDPARGRVYATLANTNQIAGFRLRPDGTLTALGIRLTVRQPNDVTVDPRTGAIIVVGAANAQLQVVAPQAFDG